MYGPHTDVTCEVKNTYWNLPLPKMELLDIINWHCDFCRPVESVVIYSSVLKLSTDLVGAQHKCKCNWLYPLCFADSTIMLAMPLEYFGFKRIFSAPRHYYYPDRTTPAFPVMSQGSFRLWGECVLSEQVLARCFRLSAVLLKVRSCRKQLTRPHKPFRLLIMSTWNKHSKQNKNKQKSPYNVFRFLNIGII